MRNVVRAVLSVILLAACDPVRATSPSRAPTLRPPSFQLVPSAFASGYIAVDLGGRFSEAVAINDAGQIVGKTSEGGALWTNGVRTDLGPISPVSLNAGAQVAGNCGSHACLWDNGTLTDLGALDGSFSSVGGSPSHRAINEAGQVAVQSAGRGFIWANGVKTELPFAPSAINDAGQVVGGFIRAFLWSNGDTTALVADRFVHSRAVDINDAGRVLGSIDPATGFVWTNGTRTDFGMGDPRLITNSGKVAGSGQVNGSDQHAFLWDSGVLTDLGTLGGNFSAATGINEAGQVVGASSAVSGGGPHSTTHAFLWTGGAMVDLGTLGGESSQARDINEDGQIVGWSQIRPDDFEAHATLWRRMTPTEWIDATCGRVNGLVTAGALPQDQADGLLAKLRQARANLDAGRTDVTVHLLEALVNQVEGLIKDGVLTQARGQELIVAARGISAQLQAASM